jgi:hypothetical protein
MVQSQLWEKVYETLSHGDRPGGTCPSSHLCRKVQNGLGWPGHKVKLYLKNKQSKKDWRPGSSNKPSKREALSSTSSTAKNIIITTTTIFKKNGKPKCRF